MVWNITKDKIVVRMTVSPDQAWAVQGPKAMPEPIGGIPDPLSDAMKAGRWNPQAADAAKSVVDPVKKEYNLK